MRTSGGLRVALVALALAGPAVVARGADPAAQAWSRVAAPAPGPPRAIGGYSGGCVQGAAQLPEAGLGFRVMRPERRRVFGHPLLVGFLRELGAALARGGIGGLPLGDLGQARGGPAPTGHASHQTGLDVDIWYVGDGKEPVSVVDAVAQALSAAWRPALRQVLAMAAADPRVDRVFVNPVVKRALCADPGDRGWLRKLRPWWGHDEHFHVRLACPADSPACVAQDPLPPGDGCDALAWWFDVKAQKARAERRQVYRGKIGSAAGLPPDCQALLEDEAALRP